MQQSLEDLEYELARALQASLRDYPAGVPLTDSAPSPQPAAVATKYHSEDPVLLIYSGELFSDDLDFMKKVVTAGLGRGWESVSLLCFTVSRGVELDYSSGARELPKSPEKLLAISFGAEIELSDFKNGEAQSSSERRVRMAQLSSTVQALAQFAGAPLILAPAVLELSGSVELKRELWGFIKPFAAPR